MRLWLQLKNKGQLLVDEVKSQRGNFILDFNMLLLLPLAGSIREKDLVVTNNRCITHGISIA
jgi:hypothetical protein